MSPDSIRINTVCVFVGGCMRACVCSYNILITLQVGNDEARHKPQVKNFTSNYAFSYSFCTSRLDLFEKLVVFIQVMASQPIYKVAKNAISKVPKHSRYGHFSNHHDMSNYLY